ncbi:MAG: ABC transporter permease subunit [bacterium]|nr:ABC transporter permease subunit [bacterium]
MNLNLLIRELKNNLKGSIVTGITVIIYIMFSLSIYSVMQEKMSKVTEFYTMIPESIRIALNFNLNQWENVLGYYVTYFVYYIPLVAGGYAIILGIRILSKEEQNRTAEFLLTRPITRGQIVASKIACIFIHLIVINLFALMTALISTGIVTDWNFNIYSMIVLHTYGFLLCFFFGTLGFFLTVLMKRAKAIIGVGLGVVLGSYIFDMMIRVSDMVQFLLYITPFKYLDLDILVPEYGFEAWRLIFFFGASGTLIFLSYIFYRKKDILI